MLNHSWPEERLAAEPCKECRPDAPRGLICARPDRWFSLLVLALTLAMATGMAGEARADILFQEGFEGLGYENLGWIEVGAPDPDYASPALEGENSLRLAGIQLVRRSFVYSDSFHLYFRVAWKIWDPYNNILVWQ